MKVVFLDFDGVLNYEGYEPVMPPPTLQPEYMSADWLVYQLVPELCSRVRRVCEITDARIVLSTSWRSALPLTRLGELMVSVGLPLPIGATPKLSPPSRDAEILQWVNATSPDSFVILDDDEIEHPDLVSFAVRTDSGTGVSELDVEAAIGLLS